MLKYNDIIEKLSDRDKIHILCDVNLLSDAKYSNLGLPEVRIGSVDDHCGAEFPSPVAMANTWNTDLVGAVAGVLAGRTVEDGDILVKVPGPKPKISPYRVALSEDAYLASQMSREYVRAVTNAGASAAVREFGLRESELEWLDEEPCPRFIAEQMVVPYANAAAGGACATILTEPDPADEKYKLVNSELKKKVSSGRVCPGAAGICEKVPADKTVLYLEHGGLFFEGSAHALESALNKYKRLKNAIEHGTSTTETLEKEMQDGRAISPEMIDEAVDRLIDFVYSINKVSAASGGGEAYGDLAFDAVRESIVLLKNKDKLLPLQSGTKFCVIGDIAMKRDENGNKLGDLCAKALAEKGLVFCGTARGYDLDKDRSEELIARAVNVAETADVVLLFLGFGEAREKRIHKNKKISIPANQQDLLSALSENRHKIIAILPPEHSPDVAVPDNCRAIMLAPLGTVHSASALVDVISGAYSPSGRLSSTVYTDTAGKYAARKTMIWRDGLKTGAFIGYRYYDTAGDTMEFPFGHGLSYVDFRYLSLNVRNGIATVKVKNCGKIDAAETVQIYVGCRGKGFVRPKKELCAFKKVYIKAGETVTVEIPFAIPRAYDVESERYVFENCVYDIFAGSSVTDVRISREIVAGDANIPDSKERLSDYIHTQSNIITDNFKLEAKADIMKKSVFNFIAGAVSLVLALALKMYCVFAGVSSLFFDLFAVLLAVLGIVFFVVEAARRSRIKSEEKEKIDLAYAQEFKEETENVGVYSADKMFLREFDIEEQAMAHEVVEDGDRLDNELLAHIDKDQTFALAADDFALFAKERGFKLQKDMVCKIFAAISASRVLVITGLSDRDFNSFMLLLANYFHAPAYIDSVNDDYVNGDHVLFRNDDFGNRIKTNANLAIESARNTTYNAHFVGLNNVKAGAISAYFTTFMKYVKNPAGCKYIVTINERNIESSYYMPHNVWFVMNLARGEGADKLPDFVAESAVVLNVVFEECEVTSEYTHVRDFSYYQIDHLAEKAATKYYVDEDVWKKVDRFEEYVNGKAQFHIGNKAWLGLERFAYTYMACGGDKANAVDSALAAKIIPSVLVTLNGVLTEEDSSVSESLDLIFGEENVYACKEIIQTCEDAAALIRADEEARLAAEEEEKLREEEERLAAEAEALVRAAEEKLAAEAEAKALEEEARLAAEAEARIREEEARLAAEAEAKLREEEARLAAEARAREEARLAAEAAVRAHEEEARLAAEAVARAREEQERLIAEAQERERQAQLAAEALAKAREEEARLAAEAERIAAEWSKSSQAINTVNPESDKENGSEN